MRISVGLGAALLAMTAATSTFAAQNGCVPNPAVTSEGAIQFLGNPAALLDQFKDGQGGLASQVRDLLTNRPESLEGMASLAKASSDDQGRAIGAGMGTAAAVCVLTQPQFAQQIQEVALKTEKPGLIQSFTSITGDIPTEAITGADANGDTTAGGGQGTTPTPSSGGAISPPPPPSFSAGAGAASQSTTTTTTLFAASTGTSSLTATSPSR
ncbi:MULTISPECIES: hypothetical protein [unclassified Bradyrhizobium]|uniref:hypothetical protein n=1 Tax=unclassified Bradyrhizobium TaxID=2631580 RepID=UPI0020B41234|nr:MULTISPECIES: hypothetical protein [unclassified Bradyrhizobium]MCP3380866.1 hypothetical protein [Bradyrhizobium sp. CCGUVB4N]MCP3441742.1 hypothetical protein [Bradyrhizobium sp. CCGUVB14]WFU79640.1 hypothetical protein QA645_34900 [Bradyrhizobium sp. CIAT3101]